MMGEFVPIVVVALPYFLHMRLSMEAVGPLVPAVMVAYVSRVPGVRMTWTSGLVVEKDVPVMKTGVVRKVDEKPRVEVGAEVDGNGKGKGKS